MDLTDERVRADRIAGSDAVSRGNRDTARRLTRAPLALLRRQRDRGYLTSVEAAVAAGRQPVAARQLVVRWEHRRTVSIIWLAGVLDRTTGSVFDREFGARPIGPIRLVVDLTGLEFIDSAGLDTLVGVHRGATERDERLSFRHGQHVAQRPRGLICAVQLRSEWAPRPARPSGQDSYFALAMACVDVDHPRPGDRPEAA